MVKADGYPHEEVGGVLPKGSSVVNESRDSDSGEDSAEEAQKDHVVPDRFDRDIGLLHQQLKQKPAPKHLAKALDPESTSTAAQDPDSGEDSTEEPQKGQVVPDRFDRDMDLLHQQLKQKPAPKHLAKALDHECPNAAQARDAGAQSVQEAEDEALAIRLQEDLLKETEDDAAIAKHLQAEESRQEVNRAIVVSGTRPQSRPDLLAAASAVAAAREEERLAEAEAEDEEESWAEEEIEHSSSKSCMQIKVRVPEGCAAGDTLEVVSPTGDLVHVVIPAGHGPGSLLMVQVQNRSQGGPQNMLYSSLTEKHSLEDWEMMLQKLASGYSVIKVARNGKLYQRNFWLAGGSLRTNGRFSSGVDLRQLTGVFRGAVSQEFIKLRKASAPAPRKSTSSIGSSLLRTFGATNQKVPLEHPDPEEAGVVIIATGGRSFSLLFPGGSSERDGFAESTTFAVQRLRQEMGRPCKF